MFGRWFLAVSLGLAMSLAACSQGKKASQDADWPDYDGPTTTHYSNLDLINDGNIEKLGLAWHYDIDVGGSSLTAPVAVDGVLYFAAGASTIHAMDAVTGKLLWKYDAQAREAAGQKLRAGWGSRGIAYANGKVFTGTIDGRLIAIDAKSGKVLWSAQTTEKDDGCYITGAPWVFKDKVIIGHGGADFAAVRGYVTAYDQATGKQAWRFFTVPGDPSKGFEHKAMEMAAKTWTGEWWKYGGGATVWNAMAYDPEYNRIYIGTGNGAPWNQKVRSPGGGDNLFVCSIVALDADTGEYVWHYQTNPGETWDFNSDMDMELTTLKIDGKDRRVLMHAPKNGYFYVIDRENGKLISANNYVPVNWAKGIDVKTGRPIENPEARFPDGKAMIVYPSPFGAHNIEAMSFSPDTGLVYIPAMDQGRVYVDQKPLDSFKFAEGQRIRNGIGAPPPDLKPRKSTSFLVAWNPLTQSEAWRVPLQGPRGSGGTAATAGNLVFAGRGSGQFTALDAKSGKLLWSFDAETAVMAQPITYLAKGKQYVTVIAGARFASAQGFKQEWSYADQTWRVLTFAIGGTDKLPATVHGTQPIVDDPTFRVDPARVKAGDGIYADRCAICHGVNALSGGTGPDLLRSMMPLDATAFASVLTEGVLISRGMPRFEDLSAAELDDLRHYIRQRAREQSATASATITNRRQDEGQ